MVSAEVRIALHWGRHGFAIPKGLLYNSKNFNQYRNTNMKKSVVELKRQINVGEMKGSESITQADLLEHQIYQAIDSLLQEGNEDIFACLDKHFDQIDENVRLLHDIHQVYHQYPLFLWFSTIDKSLIPDAWDKSDSEFMCEQFQFFVNKCLKFDNRDSNLKRHFLILVRQLISRPAGQNLIIQLNQFSEKGCTILVSGKPKGFFSVLPQESKDGICRSVKLSYPSDFHSNLALPKSFYTDENLNFGKTHSMVFKPTFISLGHELIHALHFFQQNDNRRSLIPAPYNHPLIIALFGNNFEELITIDLGEISENSLRREHGIHQRFSHHTIMKPFKGICSATAKETRQQVLSYLLSALGPSNFKNFLGEKPEPAIRVNLTIALTENFYSSPSALTNFFSKLSSKPEPTPILQASLLGEFKVPSEQKEEREKDKSEDFSFSGSAASLSLFPISDPKPPRLLSVNSEELGNNQGKQCNLCCIVL